MDIIAFALSPITFIMAAALEGLHAALSSYGWSIVSLSILVRILLLPLTRWAGRIEEGEAAKQRVMKPLISDAKRRLTGRERFERIEAIYAEHKYHPISSMKSIAAFALQIPFLLAALFLLSDYQPLTGQSFFLIQDLAKPDGLLVLSGTNVNILPITLTLVAIFEVFVIPQSSPARLRFLLIATVVLILIYGFPSAVALYWLTSNIFSLFIHFLKS